VSDELEQGTVEGEPAAPRPRFGWRWPIVATLVVAALLAAGWIYHSHRATGPVHYPDTARTSFLTSCGAGGGTAAQCGCSLRKLEAAIPYVQYQDLQKQAQRTKTLPPRISTILKTCR
jgi:hypothetical protein